MSTSSVQQTLERTGLIEPATRPAPNRRPDWDDERAFVVLTSEPADRVELAAVGQSIVDTVDELEKHAELKRAEIQALRERERQLRTALERATSARAFILRTHGEPSAEEIAADEQCKVLIAKLRQLQMRYNIVRKVADPATDRNTIRLAEVDAAMEEFENAKKRSAASVRFNLQESLQRERIALAEKVGELQKRYQQWQEIEKIQKQLQDAQAHRDKLRTAREEKTITTFLNQK